MLPQDLGLVGVKLIDVVTIPSRSELDVLAETQVTVEDGTTWLIEEKLGNHNSVLVACAPPQSLLKECDSAP